MREARALAAEQHTKSTRLLSERDHELATLRDLLEVARVKATHTPLVATPHTPEPRPTRTANDDDFSALAAFQKAKEVCQCVPSTIRVCSPVCVLCVVCCLHRWVMCVRVCSECCRWR